MLEELAALAATAGTALVDAMVSDGWHQVKGQLARLLGRGDPQATEKALTRLEESQQVLVASPAAALERAQAEQAAVWRTWLASHLGRGPEAEEELRAIVREVAGLYSAAQVNQHTIGSGQAQQAVLGTGVQNVNFGGQNGPRRR